MVAIIFLVLSTLFMVTLLQSLFKLLFGEEKIEKTGSSIIKLFAIPLISLIVFILFVMVVLPKMS